MLIRDILGSRMDIFLKNMSSFANIKDIFFQLSPYHALKYKKYEPQISKKCDSELVKF